jgi:hypothetical protein
MLGFMNAHRLNWKSQFVFTAELVTADRFSLCNRPKSNCDDFALDEGLDKKVGTRTPTVQRNRCGGAYVNSPHRIFSAFGRWRLSDGFC